MFEFTSGSGASSGDAFLIAAAMKYGLTTISEENSDKAAKIPQISRSYSIDVISIADLRA